MKKMKNVVKILAVLIFGVFIIACGKSKESSGGLEDLKKADSHEKSNAENFGDLPSGRLALPVVSCIE